MHMEKPVSLSLVKSHFRRKKSSQRTITAYLYSYNACTHSCTEALNHASGFWGCWFNDKQT